MLAALGSAAMSALSGGLNALWGSLSSARQYKYNLKLQKQAQEWQEYMSNTAHQREVTDLRAAGLNPVLSANGGASSGSVGATSVSAPAPANFDFSKVVEHYLKSKETSSSLATAAQDRKQSAELHKYNSAIAKANVEKAQWEAAGEAKRQEWDNKNLVLDAFLKQQLFDYNAISSSYALQKLMNEVEKGKWENKDIEFEFGRKQQWWPSIWRYLHDSTSAVGALMGGNVNFKVGGNK